MLRAIVLNSVDNVATLIDSGKSGEICTLQGEAGGDVALLEDVPFGHKLCIRETAAGGQVLKYGQVIGKASKPLSIGAQSHIHNVESARGRGDQVKG